MDAHEEATGAADAEAAAAIFGTQDAVPGAGVRRAGMMQQRDARNFLLIKQHAGADYNPFGSVESSGGADPDSVASLATDEKRQAALAMMSVRGYLHPVEADSHLDCRDTGLSLQVWRRGSVVAFCLVDDGAHRSVSPRPSFVAGGERADC